MPRLRARAGRRKSGQSRKGVVPPRAVVIAPGHRFAELAVIGNVDAKFALLVHHIGNGGGEDLRESGVVLAFSRGARPADGDETCRPRQASGMGGENAICTASHGSPRPFGNLRRMLERVPVIWKRRRGQSRLPRLTTWRTDLARLFAGQRRSRTAWAKAYSGQRQTTVFWLADGEPLILRLGHWAGNRLESPLRVKRRQRGDMLPSSCRTGRSIPVCRNSHFILPSRARLGQLGDPRG